MCCLHVKTEQYNMGNVITLEQMQNARSNFDDFDVFCSTFLSNVIGKQAYNKQVVQAKMSIITTASDEAFVLLCLENSMKRWEHEARDPDAKRIETMYTARPEEASKYGGWSKIGMRRFNILQRDIIPASRRESQEIEENYMIYQQNKIQPAKKSKRAKIPEDEADIPYSSFTHDLDNMDMRNEHTLECAQQLIADGDFYQG